MYFLSEEMLVFGKKLWNAAPPCSPQFEIPHCFALSKLPKHPTHSMKSDIKINLVSKGLDFFNYHTF